MVLDLPISGTNSVKVTNYVTLRHITVATNLGVATYVKMMKSDVVWAFRSSVTGSSRLFTNTIATYIAPDQ